MSGSRKKMLREENTTSNRARQAELEDAKHKRNAKMYAIAGGILVALSVLAIVWNSGFIQKGATAAVVNGHELSTGELGYYYYSVMTSELESAYYGQSAYISGTPAKDQKYDDTRSFHDYFLDEALENAKATYALADAAAAAGFSVTDEEVAAEMDTTLAALSQQATSNNLPSVEAYLKAKFGTFMDLDIFEDVLTQQLTIQNYVALKADDFTVSDEDKETYYAENADALDTYDISYMVLQAKKPSGDDAKDMTEEEITEAMTADIADKKATAEAVLAALEAGGNMTELGEEYDAYGAYENTIAMGNALNTSFSEWVMDEARTAGDLSIQNYESADGSIVVYYVVRFEDRMRDDTDTANVRHILISAGAAPTEEEYAEAKVKAEDVLAQWEEGDATSESFGDFAALYSADTSSSSSGGMITGIVPTGNYIETFQDWATDPARQPGDTGIVKNEQSSTRGWHIMYFDEWSDPQWMLIAESTLLTERMTEWNDGLLETTTAELGNTAYIG